MSDIRIVSLVLVAIGVGGCASASRTPAAPPVTVKVVAFNDFHGNLQSPGKFAGVVGQPPVSVGGADYLSAYIAERTSHNPYHIVVAAGDLIGASPLVSAAYHDEATIEAMQLIGLDLSSVGNHEFDRGPKELLRKQTGGCLPAPAHSCLEDGKFAGASFRYLAANVVVKATGKTLFPAYEVKSFGGAKIAFIGTVLKDTPSIVLPDGVAGLEFKDEADTVNSLLPELHAQGVHSVIVLIHQGATPNPAKVAPGTTVNDCAGITNDSGSVAISSIVARLDDEVDAVISAHSHSIYRCMMTNSRGRAIPVTQASAFGRAISDMDVTIDPASGRATHVDVTNILVSQPDADAEFSPVRPFLSSLAVQQIRNLISDYTTAVAPVGQQVIGTIATALPNSSDASGEVFAADLVADSELAATSNAESGGAQMSFINTSGVRNPGFNPPNATYPHDVTYQEAFTVRPFGNTLVTITLTAQQIKDGLEQQFIGCKGQTSDSTLQFSRGTHVTWKVSAAPCEKIRDVTLLNSGGIAEHIVINGMVPNPGRTYRVSMDNFLASGKSKFSTFADGRDPVAGAQDIDALVAYMKATYLAPRKPFDPRESSTGIPRIEKLD